MIRDRHPGITGNTQDCVAVIIRLPAITRIVEAGQGSRDILVLPYISGLLIIAPAVTGQLRHNGVAFLINVTVALLDDNRDGFRHFPCADCDAQLSGIIRPVRKGLTGTIYRLL